MGFINRASVLTGPNVTLFSHSMHRAYRGGKLSLVTKSISLVTKSNLVRVTIEEINSIRPSVYKYLLP
jgi:hypothetical protein